MNAVNASDSKVTCVSLGLPSSPPSLTFRPSQPPCGPQLIVRTASSADREEGRPLAVKKQNIWMQTVDGSKQQTAKEDRAVSLGEHHNSEWIQCQTGCWHHQAGPDIWKMIGPKICLHVKHGRSSFLWLKQTTLIRKDGTGKTMCHAVQTVSIWQRYTSQRIIWVKYGGETVLLIMWKTRQPNVFSVCEWWCTVAPLSQPPPQDSLYATPCKVMLSYSLSQSSFADSKWSNKCDGSP